MSLKVVTKAKQEKEQQINASVIITNLKEKICKSHHLCAKKSGISFIVVPTNNGTICKVSAAVTNKILSINNYQNKPSSI